MPPAPALFVAHHTRTGVAALQVVSAALGSDARTAGTEVVFAPSREEVALAVLDAVARGRRPVVGWSFFSTDFEVSAADLAWVKEHTPAGSALHVAGGVHATGEPRNTLRAGFDLVALGEGECTAIELFAALQAGADPRGLYGLAHLASDGALVSNGLGERRPLDAFPAFDARHGKWNAIEVTRGCIYTCTFCQTPYMFKARFRHRSVANVVEHVLTLRREGARYVRFVSPSALSYGADGEEPCLPAVEELLAAVRAAIGPDGRVYFGTVPSELRPEHVSAEALAILARLAHNRTLVIGAQSGSERVLAAARRGHGVEDVVRAVRLALEAGFLPHVDFLLGLPGETPDDQHASMALAERLVALGARVHSHAFMPLPGTPLRGSEPARIDDETSLALSHLESRGATYGQWRRQLVTAQDLLRRRRDQPSSPGAMAR